MAGRGTDIIMGGCPSTMSKLFARGELVKGGGALNKTEGERGKTRIRDTTKLTLFSNFLLGAAALLPPVPEDSYFPCAIDQTTKSMLAECGKSLFQLGGGAAALESAIATACDTTESEEDSQVSERSERALTKTRILAMNPAKWLQTKWLHSLLN